MGGVFCFMKNAEEIKKEFPSLYEAILSHCIDYDYRDEDGKGYKDKALPLGFVVEWMKAAKMKGVLDGRKSERDRMWKLLCEYVGVDDQDRVDILRLITTSIDPFTLKSWIFPEKKEVENG
jgi:hypothetical protein